MAQAPTGSNNKRNSYYANANHVRIARQDETKAAFLGAPVGEAEPVVITQSSSIVPASGPAGTTFTVTPMQVSGTGPISREGDLYQNGEVVASRVNGSTFTFTSSTDGPLSWEESAENSVNTVMSTAAATVTVPPISTFYGTGEGDVPIHCPASAAIMSGANVLRLPNLGGVGTPFDMIAGTAAITKSGGAIDMTPEEYFRFSNVPSANAPELLDTTTFIVADMRGSALDQFMLGIGSPQTDVYLKAGGAQMIFTRRSELTNNFETVTVNLNPVVSLGKRLYEISVARTGLISVTVNNQFRGSANHPSWPTLKAWNFASGRNPVNANGLNALLYDVISLVHGEGHDEARGFIRKRLNAEHNLGMVL